MAERRKEDRMRFRYGKCLNDEKCEKGKSREIIEVPRHKEFVCPECGKKLVDCAPPKRKSKTPVIAVGAVIVAAAIGAGIWWMCKPSDENMKTTIAEEVKDTETDTTTIGQDSIQEEQVTSVPVVEQKAIAVEKKEAKTSVADSQPASSEHKLSYGVWKGGWKNGQPHDTHGTMKYTSNHLIDSRDPKQRMAEPGDYVIGEWANGKLVQGVWYDSSNTVKGSILIGQ